MSKLVTGGACLFIYDLFSERFAHCAVSFAPDKTRFRILLSFIKLFLRI